MAAGALDVSTEASGGWFTRWQTYKPCYNIHVITSTLSDFNCDFISSLKIVDDDIDWRQMVKEAEAAEEEEEEAPVVRSRLTT